MSDQKFHSISLKTQGLSSSFPLLGGLGSKYGSPSLHFAHSLTGQRGARVCEMKRRRPVFRTLLISPISPWARGDGKEFNGSVKHNPSSFLGLMF
ncbi:hypothetical protein PRIPAC_84049 [Pristionchus pacificus]|uniref:Uncharacterized protein n=1 Tax=Pristionchus pacificus TaxID=54126 RepID=A0A2A6BMR6_PRIPA|nr:hypothetical protein PRIPAC_84049 [Pristionchus pacificus]|eukprot:PDM67189.1 hypothetical protein PRIPAC_48606 [Pristionchus pacificus]